MVQAQISTPATTALATSERPRGTGRISRYRRLPHAASPATESPVMVPAITTSRNALITGAGTSNPLWLASRKSPSLLPLSAGRSARALMARRMRSRSAAYACCNDWAGSRDEHFSVGADEVVKFECRAQFGVDSVRRARRAPSPIAEVGVASTGRVNAVESRPLPSGAVLNRPIISRPRRQDPWPRTPVVGGNAAKVRRAGPAERRRSCIRKRWESAGPTGAWHQAP